MDYQTARKTALRLLSMRDYHSAVLKRKLERKGFSPDVCDRVITDCKRMGFLKDDEAILREFRRGYGPKYIEYKLQLSYQEVRAVITRQMEREKIREIGHKLPREKAIRTLQRKGFDFELIIEFFSCCGVE